MLSLVDRADLPARHWNAFVTEHALGGFWHTTHWLDYSLAYQPGAEDYSFAVFEGRQIVAVVPLVMEGPTFQMGGHPGAEPLVPPDSPTVMLAVFEEVRRRAQAAGVSRWSVRSIPLLPEKAIILGAQWRDISWQTYVMDLTLPRAALWSALRRSYHAIIHKAERDYDLCVGASPAVVETAHALHRAAAGRETRSQETWDLMAHWANDGFLITALAYARTDPPEPRGMAIALRFKDAAYYGSGGTIDKNLSHALIWHLAMTLKAMEVRTFEVGWALRPHDTTDKDRQIAFFKRGFGGTPWTIVAGEMDL